MYALFEIIGEVFLVQENIRIVVFLVESVFHLLKAFDDSGEVTVPRQYDKSRVGSSVLYRVGHLSSFVIFIWYALLVRW